MKPIRTLPSVQVIVRAIRPYGSTAGSLLAWESEIVPPAQNGEPPMVDPSRTSPAAIGSEPGAEAMTFLVRITIGLLGGSTVEDPLVPAVLLPPHAPGRRTPIRTSTTALRMTAPRAVTLSIYASSLMGRGYRVSNLPGERL